VLLECLAVPDVAISDRWSRGTAQRIARFVASGGDHETLCSFFETLHSRILAVEHRISPLVEKSVDGLAVSIRAARTYAMNGIERMPAGQRDGKMYVRCIRSGAKVRQVNRTGRAGEARWRGRNCPDGCGGGRWGRSNG
jgi:hypothetical protein